MTALPGWNYSPVKSVYWKIFIGLSLIVVGIVVWMMYPSDSHPGIYEHDTAWKNTAIEIWGMRETLQKIPFDTKVLSLTLDAPIDSGSLASGSITLSPYVEGKVSLSPDNKTISYTLMKHLMIGESYDLMIASSVRKIDGKTLEKDIIETFLAMAPARIMKIFPTGPLDTLSQNITVVFNTPMVPLTNLDERDTLPCPLTITPKVEGKCVWTNTSILEYIPTIPLQWATRYRLSVADVPGLLHTLSGTFEEDIMTTPLRVTVAEEFSPKSGIPIVSNFPVSIEDLRSVIDLTTVADTSKTSSGTRIDLTVTALTNEDGTLSETRFTLMPKNQKFTYTTYYSLIIHAGLKSKYGTQPLAQDMTTSLYAPYFIGHIEAFQNVFDHSGAIIDTKSYGVEGVDGTTIASEKIFFLADFDEAVPLDKSLLVIRGVWDASLIDFDIAYGKLPEYDSTGNIIKITENKQQFKITAKTALKKDAKYEIVFLKKSNPALLDDEVKTFLTAPELSITGLRLLSNTVGCVYTNNEITNIYDKSDRSAPRITMTPASRLPTLSPDSGQYLWNKDGSTYTIEYTCPQVSWKHVYIVDLRLNPLLAYTISFLPALTDVYGQSLAKSVPFTVKTGVIADADRYLYSGAGWMETQVIPSSLPIVLGLLSVNADAANIEACEMDQSEYISFLWQQRNSAYANPECVKKSLKKIPIKNRYWTTTPTQIDLEKEVLSGAFTTPYISVRGSLWSYENDVSQKRFSHVFIRSNLSLTFEDGKNSRSIFASSYDGKTVPSDLKFEAYQWIAPYGQPAHYEKIEKFPIAYNATKKLYTIMDPDINVDLIIAKNATFYWVLNLSQDRTSNYDFKYISGQDASDRDYLYIYPDRPLYQLGDTVSFKGILRNYHFDGYRPSQMKTWTIKIIGGQWSVSGESVIAEMDVTIDENSNIHGTFTLPKSAPLGRYTFEFTGSGSDEPLTTVYNNGEFFIEAYKKPVFKIMTDPPKGDVMVGDAVDIHSHAEYYFGGVLPWAEYQYSILAQSYYFNPRDYSEYHFWEGSAYMDCLYWGSCEYHDTLIASGTGRLDTHWDALVHREYRKWETVWEQIYTYSLEVTDPDTEKTVNQSVSQIVHATDAYVGVMAPYWNSGKSWIKLDGIVLDLSAKWLKGKSVGLELIRREWKNVKKEWVDGIFYNEWSIEETIIARDSTQSDAKWEFTHTFLSATGGEYEIRASYTGSNGIAFVSSIYAYVSGGDENNYWYEGNNTVADITPDKTILSVGDRAGFTLKTPLHSGKMLVSIEKDDGVLDSYVQDITDTTMRIEFPILDSHIPNVYVKVFAIGQNPGDTLPIYKRALSVVKVLPDSKKLTVSVTTDKKKYLPGEGVRMTVTVKDVTGKWVAGANGSLSIVDESLLALAGNPLKNPFAYFYDMKRYLGVVTYTSLLSLVQKLEVKDTSLGEKWWAGEWQKWGLSKKKRGVFKDTAYWQADFTTDQDGNYILNSPILPDNLTTWVIEALVNTRKSEIGIATTHIQTSKNVLINDNLPRFLGTSDAIQIAPVIFNKTEKDATFDISVQATNVSLKNQKQSIEIKAWAQAVVPFDLIVDGIEKIRLTPSQASKITITAVSRVTEDQDSVELTIPIIETSTREIVATSGRADPVWDEIIELSGALRNNGGSLDIHYAATLLPGLLSGLDFLRAYPYGCIEQKLATIMPQIYLKELYDTIGLPYDLNKIMVKKYISRSEGYRDIPLKDVISDVVHSVSSYQQPDGGFGYWIDSEYSDIHLTLSVVSRLQDLERIGFTLDPAVRTQVAKYLKNVFYTNTRPFCREYCTYAVTDRLQMIEWVLDAVPDDYEAYKMYQILSAEMKNTDKNPDSGTDFSLAHARLLVELSKLTWVRENDRKSLLTKAIEIIKKVGNENIVMNPRWAFIGRSESSSRLSNTLSFVEGVTRIGGDTLIEYQTLLDQMSRWIMSQKARDGSWGSTLDTTSVIRSITEIERTRWDIRNIDLTAILTLDGKWLQKQKIGTGNKLETFSTGFSLHALQDISRIHFEKSGTGRIYYDIALEYALQASGLKSRDEGFFLESAYYDYASYQIVEKAKQSEWIGYIQGAIEYRNLKYPNEIITYLKPLKSLQIGKLVMVYNRMITPEPRDQLAFEGFIPAGAELVNPKLKTESQDVRNASSPLSSIFDHEEWQDDRYFATRSHLDAWVYTFGYIFRPTHAGTYELRPSRASEFYHPEIFGRNAGKSVQILK